MHRKYLILKAYKTFFIRSTTLSLIRVVILRVLSFESGFQVAYILRNRLLSPNRILAIALHLYFFALGGL